MSRRPSCRPCRHRHMRPGCRSAARPRRGTSYGIESWCSLDCLTLCRCEGLGDLPGCLVVRLAGDMARDLVDDVHRSRHLVAGDVGAQVDPDVVEVELSAGAGRSEEHTSELQSLMRISYAVFCL